jgi:hypothetical protein
MDRTIKKSELMSLDEAVAFALQVAIDSNP